jgi:hypothetical protein
VRVGIGMTLAMSRGMQNDPLIQLLTEIHHNVERVCEDLQRDRPDLAQALRENAAWIPCPEDLQRGVLPSTKSSVRRLGPLLYDALDEGIVDAHRFDALMVARSRAERVIAEKAPRRVVGNKARR